MSGPTYEHGHTLDLALSQGLSVSSLEICDNVFSDHMPVLLEVAFSCTAVKCCTLAQRRRTFNRFTASQCTVSFDQLCVPLDSTSVDTEEHSLWFHSSCQTILGSLAPLKTMQPKVKPEHWFSDRTRAARQECHEPEERQATGFISNLKGLFAVPPVRYHCIRSSQLSCVI